MIELGPGKRFQFHSHYCKGCGICVPERPCGASRMEPENRWTQRRLAA
jgi:Pyruvate/2-oxoacid:ferredoxin oxidoreductase delta subunit